MILNVTESEAEIIEAALVIAHSAYRKTGEKVRNRAPRCAERCEREAAIAGGVRWKILIAKYGETRAAEIAAERATVPTLEELYNGEPANGGTHPPCYADNGDAPYCAGADCREWGECHGDKLRGHSDTRGALP